MSINLEFLQFIFLSENGPKFTYFQLPTHGDSIYESLNDRSYEKWETWDTQWLKRLINERLEQAISCKKLSSLYGRWKWDQTFPSEVVIKWQIILHLTERRTLKGK